jgi:hypothetical protein
MLRPEETRGENIHCMSNINKILNYIYMNEGLILVKSILSILGDINDF